MNQNANSIDKTLENFKKSLTEKKLEGILNSSIEIIDYIKTIKDKKIASKLNKQLSIILDDVNSPEFKELNQDEINNIIIKVEELENLMVTEAKDNVVIETKTSNELEKIYEELKTISEKLKEPKDPYELGKLDGRKYVLEQKIKELRKNAPIPTTLSNVRAEIEMILDKPLLEGIEKESEFSIVYNLDDKNIKKIQSLRNEIQELLKNEKDNKEKIDILRMEIAIILNIDPYTYGKNKEIIDSLEEPDKTRFENLKSKYEELMQKELEERKKQTPKENFENKIEQDEIRKRMAEIIYKDPAKAYVGIEEEAEKNPVFKELSEEDQKEFLELREKLKQKKQNTEMIPYQGNKTTEKTEGKKGRLVKAVKSAYDFYKRHKKAFHIVGGIVLTAIVMPSLLPSIMHFNSILWHHAVASQTVGLPVLLHDINLLIGSNIGATFASSTGIWTLANGAVLNAGAASASLLASLGKVALTMGAIGVGSTVAIKNAYNLAKEKYKNRTKKVKIEKHNIFDNINDAFKKHTEKSKEETKEKTKKEPEKVVNTEKTEDKKPFFRGDVNDRINQTVNYLIKKNVISEPTKKELEKMSKEEFIAKFKDIFNEHYQVNKTEDKNESKTTTFYRDDIAPEINEYIQNAINKGNYSSEAEVEALYQIDPENLTEWIKYEMNFSKEETEENKMGGK